MSTRPDDSAEGDAVHDLGRFDAVAEAACERLARNERVRRNLPGGGRLRIDRQLPFLCLYRSPCSGADVGTRQLITTEAAYLFASGKARYNNGLDRLCQRIQTSMREHFGTFLFLEIWAEPVGDGPDSLPRAMAPTFELVTSDPDSFRTTFDAFAESLNRITVHGRRANVNRRVAGRVFPPGLSALSHACSAAEPSGCCVVGVAVNPIYRGAPDGPIFPMILQRLRQQMAGALRRAIAQFAGIESGRDAVHYESLGPSSIARATRIADQELCDVAESFDFLLQVTPTNRDHAWTEFAEGGYRRAPTLNYRPLPYHPSHLKRRLFSIEIERIEDPTLSHIFWEKQDQVDWQLTALRDIDTPRFLFSSRQLYGDADDELVALAEAIIERSSHDADRDRTTGGALLNARDFVKRARDEIDHYHQISNTFNASVEVCDNIAAGIMVSQNRLLVADTLRLRPERVEPLLHHEIGTHLLTYFNGRSQPLRQLYAGLAGYEELQEGLAVLAEFLCGGLTARRLRILGARVMAVRSLTDGETFAETFARLHESHKLSARQAFVSTLRVHRGGGLTKDAIYLRGLRNVLQYLSAGHDIEPLYVGKIGLHHLPCVREMRRRGIIHAPSLLPRFWDHELVREQLEACRGLAPLDLLEKNR
jgi:uncharacterized protein (TIGR02421 family)